jgi:hypothetical protein
MLVRQHIATTQTEHRFLSLSQAPVFDSSDTIAPFNRTLLFAALAIIMATSIPFISRLMRPFTSSTKLGLNPEGSAQVIPEGAQKCTVAAGCFWGVEHLYRKHFEGKGLIDARVGYIGGDKSNPSYRAVCSGSTGREYTRARPCRRARC